MQITSISIIIVLCFYIGINGENLELSAEKLLSKLDSSHDLFMKVSNAVLKKIVDYQILSEKLENWKAVTSDLDEVTKGVRSAAESTLNAMIENPSRFTPQDKVISFWRENSNINKLQFFSDQSKEVLRQREVYAG